MSDYDEQAKLREFIAGVPPGMFAKLTGTFPAATSDECPKCGGVEWDHVEKERGMHPSDLPINRCPCGHEWKPS